MEVKKSKTNEGKGVFLLKPVKKDDVIYILKGEIFSSPTRESIRVGENQHIYDEFGIFINHSFTPNIFIRNKELVALKDINLGEEITFNYNDNEINMAAPFYVDNVFVSGRKKTY